MKECDKILMILNEENLTIPENLVCIITPKVLTYYFNNTSKPFFSQTYQNFYSIT